MCLSTIPTSFLSIKFARSLIRKSMTYPSSKSRISWESPPLLKQLKLTKSRSCLTCECRKYIKKIKFPSKNAFSLYGLIIETSRSAQPFSLKSSRRLISPWMNWSFGTSMSLHGLTLLSRSIRLRKLKLFLKVFSLFSSKILTRRGLPKYFGF